MAKYASKVVGQAQAWLGRKESDGSHKEIIDVYNGHKPLARGYKVTYTDAWCATFVSAVAIKLGYTSIIPTECSCSKMIDLFKKLGSFVENDSYKPAPGTIIFYDWDDNGAGDNTGSADHVGIIEKVSGSTITVIEGNYSNSVKRRTLAVNGRYIRGYGVPKYDAEPTAAPTTTSIKKGDKVKVNKGAKTYNGTSVASFVYNGTFTVDELKGDRAVLDKNGICTAFNVKNLTLATATTTATPKIQVGSTVKLNKGAKTYTGGNLASFVYNRKHKVKEISGSRVVITYLGIVIAAVNIKDLTLA
jgi:hypothetical protein